MILKNVLMHEPLLLLLTNNCTFPRCFIDDRPVVVAGLKTLLSQLKNIEVAGCVSNAFDAIPFLKQHKVDLILLDINLPDVMAEDNLPKLTKREKAILNLIAEGLTNNQIAEKLFISPLTADSHRKNLLTKFNVNNTASLVRVAIENRLI